MLDNPRTADFPERLRGVSNLFNACYGLVYVTMSDLYSGTQDQGAAIGRLYALMSGCLAPTAQYLARHPVTEDRTAARNRIRSGVFFPGDFVDQPKLFKKQRIRKEPHDHP